jgi:hypothetical protein
MKLRRRACLGLLTLAPLAPAAAQINPFGERARPFAEADRRRMYAAMRTVLESGRVGETAAWTATDGTFGGVAELRRVYERDGMRCGELRHRFVGATAAAGVYDVRACEVPGEGWKFAF